jgi:hypothetical protein
MLFPHHIQTPQSRRAGWKLFLKFPLLDLEDSRFMTGDCALDQEEIFLGADIDYLKVFNRFLIHAHMSRHPLPFGYPGRPCRTSDGTWFADIVGTMPSRATAETMTFDGAGKTLAFGSTYHIHKVADLKQIYGNLLAKGKL